MILKIFFVIIKSVWGPTFATNFDLLKAYKLMVAILSMGKRMINFLAAGFLFSVRNKFFSLYVA